MVEQGAARKTISERKVRAEGSPGQKKKETHRKRKFKEENKMEGKALVPVEVHHLNHK